MRFSILASGSSGNALYIETARARLLVDAGLSGREVTRRLGALGVHPSELEGILVTHEHADHIHGVGVLARRFALPVYIHPAAREAGARRLGQLPRVVRLETGGVFEIGDLGIRSFSIPHDAVNPLGFTFSRDGKKLGLATDMGCLVPEVLERLSGCNALILESNHDPEMLRAGPYAWPLKQRILGRGGHLSNGESSRMLQALLHNGLESVVLAHLSEVNNLPRIALEAAARALRLCGREVRLTSAGPHGSGGLLEVQGNGGPF